MHLSIKVKVAILQRKKKSPVTKWLSPVVPNLWFRFCC